MKNRSECLGVRRGFTLVELLVSIAIIGVLLALFLPAVQRARETARITQCRNNLKQMALGVINAEGTYGRYPSNGWGWQWVGDPDRGYGDLQPGGWVYQILPFLEQANLKVRGRGLPDPLKRLEMAAVSQISLPVLRCPTRAASDTCPTDPIINWYNAEVATRMARTDYAANGGSIFTGVSPGPMSLSEGDDPAFNWTDTSIMNGIVGQHSRFKHHDITDGHSNTYLIGEKFVSSLFYHNYGDRGYDQSFIVGDDWDLVRWTNYPPLRDEVVPDPERFGSAHDGGFQVAMCDGSVRTIIYNVDEIIHRHLGSRNDGQVVSLP